ncbi:prepilin-type N-terminal cleavage/methylation domain-containing protein [Erwinia sp. E_sp_W01_1]
MNRMRGFTLTELLIVMMIASMLTLGAFSGWQSWQQLQRLNDSARQIQHFLLRLRGEANEHNSSLLLWYSKDQLWCIGSGAPSHCAPQSRRMLPAPWPEIVLLSLTEGMGFYGRHNVARPGRIVIAGKAGERHIIVSSRGRVRICEDACP